MVRAIKRNNLLGGKRNLVLVAGLALGLYVIVPQFSQFDDVLPAILHAQLAWMAVGVLLLASTFVVAGALYLVLAPRRLHLRRAVLVQVAGMFAGRILPAGLGAIGVSYEYLRRNKHTAAEAGVVVAVNNFLGLVGNALLVLSLLALGSSPLPTIRTANRVFIAIGVAVVVLAICLLLLSPVRRRIVGVLRSSLAQLRRYEGHPWRIVMGIGLSVVLTALYGGMLYVSAQAVQVPISFVTACIVMSMGVLGATASPTPGGLGGAEAGLVAGLVLYGVSAEQALPAALLYRLLTYWLPLLPGAAAFVLATRRKYI